MVSKFAGMGLSVDKPVRMELLHPTTRQPIRDDQGQAAYLDLYSNDSNIARQHNTAIQRRRLRNLRGRVRVEPEELEADTVDLLAALTAGWYLLNLDGTPGNVPFTPENAREMYADASMAWAREQADEFISDRGNFLPASSTT